LSTGARANASLTIFIDRAYALRETFGLHLSLVIDLRRVFASRGSSTGGTARLVKRRESQTISVGDVRR